MDANRGCRAGRSLVAVPGYSGATVSTCLRRARMWRVPPNWSKEDWRQEFEAHGWAAACEAECDFDPQRGVPLDAFVYRRVQARVYTRYRQEWTFALRFVGELDEADGEKDQFLAVLEVADDPQQHWSAWEDVQSAVAQLPEPGRWLIAQLFWEGRSEKEIAGQLGISRQAVSKRKLLLLRRLRAQMGICSEKEASEVAKQAGRGI